MALALSARNSFLPFSPGLELPQAAPEGAVCGLDEAGRGCLAGPVCAACAVLPGDFPSGVLSDSKKLSPAKREAARRVIEERAVAWGVGWASPKEIDEINILRASLLAMKRAYEDMAARPREGRFGEGLSAKGLGLQAVVDGLYCPDLPIPCRAVVKADASVPAVMAASILAKTSRDRLMVDLDARYPGYGYALHKGYPTRAHRGAIASLGPSPIQRLTFTVKR